MRATDVRRQFWVWIASAVAGTGVGTIGLVRERDVIEGLLASGSPGDRALAATLTAAFVAGAVIGLAMVALQVTFAVLLRHGHHLARRGLLVLAVLVLAAVLVRLASGDAGGAAVTILLVTQAVLILSGSGLLLRSHGRTPTGAPPVR